MRNVSRPPRVLQLWATVIGVSGVVSFYASGERWSAAWAGLWMQLTFFGGIIAFLSWVFGRAYEQELSEDRTAQDDLLNPPIARPMTEDERNRMLMRRTLPRWRRVLGWAAIAIPCLSFWLLLSAALRYGGGSGWAILFACLAFIVLLGLGSALSDWFWKPYRKAQADAEQSRKRVEG